MSNVIKLSDAGLRAVANGHMKCGCSMWKVENNLSGQKLGEIDEQCESGFVGTLEAIEDEFVGDDIGEMVSVMAKALGLNPNNNG